MRNCPEGDVIIEGASVKKGFELIDTYQCVACKKKMRRETPLIVSMTSLVKIHPISTLLSWPAPIVLALVSQSYLIFLGRQVS